MHVVLLLFYFQFGNKRNTVSQCWCCIELAYTGQGDHFNLVLSARVKTGLGQWLIGISVYLYSTLMLIAPATSNKQVTSISVHCVWWNTQVMFVHAVVFVLMNAWLTSHGNIIPGQIFKLALNSVDIAKHFHLITRNHQIFIQKFIKATSNSFHN